MAKAKKLIQLSFTMPRRVGLLSEVSSVVSAAKVNFNAICAYEVEDKAYFMLITDSNARSKKALSKLSIETKEDDVIVVEMPNKVGELHKVAKKIADAGININYVYGTTGIGKSSSCVFKTTDNTKAIIAINK